MCLELLLFFCAVNFGHDPRCFNLSLRLGFLVVAEHLKHLKHLKHLMWMFGLNFCQHIKELGGKVNDDVHGRQDQ